MRIVAKFILEEKTSKLPLGIFSQNPMTSWGPTRDVRLPRKFSRQ